MVDFSARQRLSGKDSQPRFTAGNEDAAVAQQRCSVTRPRVNHVSGTRPSVHFRIEQLTARAGEPIDIGTTGDQYSAVLQKGRGMGDMPLVQVWRRNPRPKVSCPGLSGQSARGAKPTQYCDHDGAPKQ